MGEQNLPGDRYVASKRLRMNLDLRDSSGEGSQRMLNAIEPVSILPFL